MQRKTETDRMLKCRFTPCLVLQSLTSNQRRQTPVSLFPRLSLSTILAATSTNSSSPPSSNLTSRYVSLNAPARFLIFLILIIIQVLRFFGYFKESVVESRLENFRIHDVLVYYFLEDKSIMIIEPKQTNSGVP